jgi:hypothetical protein
VFTISGGSLSLINGGTSSILSTSTCILCCSCLAANCELIMVVQESLWRRARGWCRSASCT